MPDFHYIKDWDGFEWAINTLKSLDASQPIAIDTETTGLDLNQNKIRLIQIAWHDHPAIVLDCFELDIKYPDLWQPLLNKALKCDRPIQEQHPKIYHNAAFDVPFLWQEGIQAHLKSWDTMLMAYLVFQSQGKNESVSLKRCCEIFLGNTLDKEQQESDWGPGELSWDQLNYAADDAIKTLDLFDELQTANRCLGSLEYIAKIESECAPMVGFNQLNGFYINPDDWESLATEIDQEVESSLTEAKQQLGNEQINLNSPKQLCEALTVLLGRDITSTSKQALVPLQNEHPAIDKILEYRGKAKLQTSFIRPIREKLVNSKTGRVHPSVKQTGAISGRMSCTDPNLQQIPKGTDSRFRYQFQAPKGKKLIVADYSQLELRLMAAFSGDQRMSQVYQEGGDIHTLTASLLLGKSQEEVTKDERKLAKAANFGLIYGQSTSSFKLYCLVNFGIELSDEEANKFRNNFFNAYPAIKEFHNNEGKRVKQFYGNNYDEVLHVQTISGRKIGLSKPAFNKVINYPIQGSGGDIAKLAYWYLKGYLPSHVKTLIQVHDEIVLEVPESEAQDAKNTVEYCMEEAGDTLMSHANQASIIKSEIPIEVEAGIGINWGNADE